jgi:hypothetical protein
MAKRPSNFFSLKNQSLKDLGRSIGGIDCFEQDIKWDHDVALSLDFGLGLLETAPYAPIPISYRVRIFSPFLWTLNKVWLLNPTPRP